MTAEDLKEERMGWEKFGEEIAKLSKLIDFQPDIVVGVVRGGVIPAGVLADTLNVKDMYFVMIKRDGEKRKLASEIAENITDKNILLVEDSLETGRSLVFASEYLKDKGATVKTACLYTVDATEINPDYSLGKVPSIPLFPWE
ncbi:MAG: hypothetical protein KA035_02465 [Candidatus Levybacteria bacterium]|nr:hypothetical protein [Candidatus Levybacteria bacterium]